MALAMEREQTAYRSLMMLTGTVLADPEPMLARLVRDSRPSSLLWLRS